MNFAVIVNDHKPDYQHIDRPNQDAIDILTGNGQTNQDTTWIEGANADYYYLGDESTAFRGLILLVYYNLEKH